MPPVPRRATAERKGRTQMDQMDVNFVVQSKKEELDREAASLQLQEAVAQHRLWNHEAEKHTQHLCFLSEHKQMATVLSLVGNAQYICGACGRVAASPDNLCDPIYREC